MNVRQPLIDDHQDRIGEGFRLALQEGARFDDLGRADRCVHNFDCGRSQVARGGATDGGSGAHLNEQLQPAVYESELPGWPPGPLGVAVRRDGGVVLRSGLSKGKRRMALALGRLMSRQLEEQQGQVSP